MSGKEFDMHIPAEFINRLHDAKRITVLTGAGVSKESGVPTFREPLAGLWEKFDPEQLTSVEGFRKNPKLVWDWHNWLAAQMAAAEPNVAHKAIACMANILPQFTLITQNIDGLHQRAGSCNVLELHGNIHRIICSKERALPDGMGISPVGYPVCINCGAPLRHDVVWFGESIPEVTLQSAILASQSAEVFFSVGTSSLVQPAANLAHLARQNGGCIVEVNPSWTPLSEYADYCFRIPGGKFFGGLLNLLQPQSN